jgi:hypothetical protein
MNYTGDHPLNLLSTLAVITSASFTTSAAICRALLNSNALVLGVNSREPHPSTQSSKASHFQFLRYEGGDCGKVRFKGSIVREAERGFGGVGVDVLVVVKGDGEGGVRLEGMRDVVDVMKSEGRGLIVNVYEGDDPTEEAGTVSSVRWWGEVLMDLG